MRNLKNTTAIYAKGLLFLLIGLASAGLLLLDLASLRGFLLLSVCIGAFCRAYYFAFYVIEKYVDAQYRFSGLISFGRYLLRSKRRE